MDYRSPRVATAAHDPQRERAYAAEEQAQLEHSDYEDEDDLTPEQLRPYVLDVMARAGWSHGDDGPSFVLDVPDEVGETDEAGWVDGVTGTIHLHPRLLDPWTVLHEVAHWLRPRDGHGPRWAAVFVGLIRAGVGTEAGERLLTAYEVHGVEVDPGWLGT
jgi:hypothetical protein